MLLESASILNGTLDPDDDGRRVLRLEVESGRGVLIELDDRSGLVRVARTGPDASTPTEAYPRNPEDSIDVVPSRWGTPTGAPFLVLPAGTVPIGVEVESAVWSADHRFVAVLTRLPHGTLSIYEVADGVPHELWREANMGLSMESDLSFKDLNADGSLEVVYRALSGNFWMSAAELAVSVWPDSTVSDLPFVLPIERSSPDRPEDLDGDGVYEWWAADASWESRAFAHAYSPISWFVLAWNGEAYVDASSRFGSNIVGRGEASQGSYRSLPLAVLLRRFLDLCNAQRFDEAHAVLAEIRSMETSDDSIGSKESVLAGLTSDADRPYCH
ncbi:MAG: hypothetical protein HY873_11800 [Chloroflexi bacterium]|nr:hypothetical protein [Chloroflexota bacterium]